MSRYQDTTRIAPKLATKKTVETSEEKMEIKELASLFEKDRFEQIKEALGAGDVRRVRELAMAVRAEYVPVHDGFRDAAALTLAYLYETYGLEKGEAMGRACIEKAMPEGDPPQYAQADLRDRIRTIAFGWHWHASRFRLTEDDEKVTFHLLPCGSGMRLIQEGYYEKGPFGPPEAGFAGEGRVPRSKSPSKSNFMTEDFPAYCHHCSEMGHISLKNGVSTFIVEGWTPLRSRGMCIQHTFKDASLVPDEFYRRADLPVPNTRDKPEVTERLFSPEELHEIETHPLDRLVDRAERGDVKGALESVEECLVGWRDSIHDVYCLWPPLLWREVLQDFGDEALADAVRATAPEIFAHIRGAGHAGWAAFWSIHLRLRGIEQRERSVEFTVGPESIIAPDVLPWDFSCYVVRLNEGMEERGWKDLGHFEVKDRDLVHRLPLT